MENSILTVSVSQVNNYIKRLLDANSSLCDICVSGELSNVKCHFSGHIYMTLKDEKSKISAVMFKGDAMSLRFNLENGMKVLVRGRVSVYERDGQYQLYAKSIEPDGIGALYAAFEQKKAKLMAEGLFLPEHKKPIPKFPEKIGVITAPTGAAVRDIINVLSRRYPLAEILVFPALVQGSEAAADISKKIYYVNEHNLCDVLIVGRGGGSIEDLWAFNEEILARAVFASKIPVISAVGHETDFTICDFVADLRAPTPSAAAELCVPDVGALKAKLSNLKSNLSTGLIHLAKMQRKRLERFDEFVKKEKILAQFDNKRCELDDIFSDLKEAQDRLIKKSSEKLDALIVRLSAQNPLNLLQKGYAVARCGDKIIKSQKDVTSGDEVNLRLYQGEISCKVN